MAIRVYVLFAVVVLAGVFTGGAQAQLLGMKLVNISGFVPCSIGNLIDVASSPVFPNATVQLVCNGNVLATTTTSSNGFFSLVPTVTNALLNILSSCTVNVVTPLASCKVGLPTTGGLQSMLGGLGLGGILSGILSGILNLIPQGFSFIPNI